MSITLTKKYTERIQSFNPFYCAHASEDEISTPTDPVFLQAFKSAANDYKTCHEEIEILSHALKQLKRQKRDLKQYILACESLTRPSPIRNLPTELLRHILDYLCQDLIYVSRNGIRGAWCLTIGLVCWKWHSLLQSCPSLFADLCITIDPNYQTNDEEITKFVRRSLDVSGSRLLSLKILRSSDPNEYHKGYPPLILDRMESNLTKCLARSFPRVRHLDILTSPLLRQRSDTFTALRTLVLDSTAFSFDDSNKFLSLPYSAAHIQHLILRSELGHFTIRASQITHLSLDDCRPSFVLFALRYCNRIESLVLGKYNELVAWGSYAPKDPLILQNLTHLEVHQSAEHFLDNTLQYFRAPELDSLSIQYERYYPSNFMPQISNLLSHSKRSLKSLELICGTATSCNAIISIATTHRTIQHLVIATLPREVPIPTKHVSRYDDVEFPVLPLHELLQHIHWPELPDLRSMEMDFREGDVGGFDRELIDMVESRWRLPTESRTLESVVLRVKPERMCSDASLKALYSMQEEGLRVFIGKN